MDSCVRNAGLDDIPRIVQAARVVWQTHYPGIISQDQIEYMLLRMYDPEVIASEMQEGGVIYYLAEREGALAGFAACGPGGPPGEFKLHKLYVLPQFQRAGWGRRLIEAAVANVRQRSGERLSLCVNKRNASALAAYSGYGFRVRESVCVDIGGGFQMDDFVLELDLRSTRLGIEP